MTEDLYNTLGVSRDATDVDIKKAYRRLAQKYHPDRNKGGKESEKKFKEINTAYETLSDKQKRATYDQFGTTSGHGGSPFDQSGGVNFQDLGGMGGNFADIFETFFGGGGSRGKKRGPQTGEDLEINIHLDLKEAAFGTQKEVMIERIEGCETCKGIGAKPGTSTIPCSTCGGKGEVHSVQTTILGQMTTRRVCETCRGAGKVPEVTCGECHGNGRIRVRKKLNVKIPAGVYDGAVIRLTHQGNAGIHGGGNGDLYAHMSIQPDKQFERRNDDVYSTMTIHLLQAILGDEIEVETIHGTVKLHIPAGTESGKLFRIKNYGITKLHGGGQGDHFVRINIDTPKKLSKKERQLYEELAKEARIHPKGDKGVFGKIFE